MQVWRVADVMVIIGDLLQSAVKVFGKKNPFGEQLAMSILERWAKAGYPYHYLKETMRATKGLVTLSNHLFYDNNLISGPKTDLDHATRAMTVRWREHVKQKYPGLKDEPQGETTQSSSTSWEVGQKSRLLGRQHSTFPLSLLRSM